MSRILANDIVFKPRDFSKLVRYSGNPILPKGTAVINTESTDAPYIRYENKIGNTWYALVQVSQDVDSSIWEDLALYTSTDLINWTLYSDTPAITHTHGSWDEKMVCHPSIINIGGTWYCYYTGTNAAGKGTVGLATSPDMITWTKYGSNPVYSTAGNVFPPSVILIGETYYMYYYDGGAVNVGTIEYATSPDGLTWTYGGKCFEIQANDWFYNYFCSDPWIIKNSLGLFELVFTASTGTISEQKLGYAISWDGKTFYPLGHYILAPGIALWENYAVGDGCLLEKPDGATYLYYVGIAMNDGHSTAEGAVAMID